MAVKKSSKIVKKKWVKILAPTVLRESTVGETYISDPAIMIGKKMTVGLGTITGEPQRQHTHVNLIITSFDDGIYKTELLGYKLLPSSVKKMVRRNRSRIDDSFVVLTKDQKYVRVKPIIITRNKTQCSVQTALRKKARVELAKNFAQKEFNTILGELLGRRFQHGVARLLSKIFPVGLFEIRQIMLVTPEKAKKMSVIRFVAEKKVKAPAQAPAKTSDKTPAETKTVKK